MIFCVCSITWYYIWADVSIKAGWQSPLRLTAVCLACKQPSYLGFALWPSSMHGSLVTPSAYAYGKVIENPAADMAAILFSLMREHLHLHADVDAIKCFHLFAAPLREAVPLFQLCAWMYPKQIWLMWNGRCSLVVRTESKVQVVSGWLCLVLGQDTLSLQCLSPPKSRYGHWQTVRET